MKFIQKHTKIILAITIIVLNCATCQLKFGDVGTGLKRDLLGAGIKRELGAAGLKGGLGASSSPLGVGGAGKAPRPIPQSVCTIKSDPGFCNLVMTRWYFDWRYHRCLPFMYTGCGGNINNFISPFACKRATSKCYSPPPPHGEEHELAQHPQEGYHHHDVGEEQGHHDPGYHQYHHYDPGHHEEEEEEEEEEEPTTPNQYTHFGHYAPTIIIKG